MIASGVLASLARATSKIEPDGPRPLLVREGGLVNSTTHKLGDGDRAVVRGDDVGVVVVDGQREQRDLLADEVRVLVALVALLLLHRLAEAAPLLRELLQHAHCLWGARFDVDGLREGGSEERLSRWRRRRPADQPRSLERVLVRLKK